jgi:hypothetical protein
MTYGYASISSIDQNPDASDAAAGDRVADKGLLIGG